MKGLVTAVAACLLSGCGLLTPKIQTKEVMVPVPVPCRTAPVERPVFAVDQLKVGARIDEQMRALRAERQQRIGYEEKLEAAANACR